VEVHGFSITGPSEHALLISSELPLSGNCV